MSPLIAGLAPVFILIAIGYAARAGKLATPEAFGAVNRFGYFVLYPAFLFSLTSGADFTSEGAGPFLIGILGGVLAAIVLALATRAFFRSDGPAFTSVFQGSLRWNGFVLLAAALPLYGEAGLDLIGIAFGPLVLTMNVVCVMVLARWGSSRADSWRAVLDQIVANPLILSCAAGIAVNLAGFHDFGPLSHALGLLGDAAMPVAVICVGAGLDFGALRTSGVRVAFASAFKLLLMPAILFFAVKLAGAGPLECAIAAGLGATPTAAAGYTLAREMGGDAQLVAAIITATTLLSFLTMPLVIGLTLP
ncbi:MAG: AEC family transporter [Hyphomonadaceae bacterium]|nr:AEC family transporter [Hyphomonadaceae bacterium]